jgi:hypothetical protein
LNNSKVASTKTTSAIFLATVLLTGTITALSSSSFMTIGTVQAQPYYGMDKKYSSYESDYGMDNNYQKHMEKIIEINPKIVSM